MGEAYNFCDCKNNDPRLEEKLPDSNHKDLININNHSSTSSKKNTLSNLNNKSLNDIIEDIKRKNATNLIIKKYRQHKLKCSIDSFYDTDNHNKNRKVNLKSNIKINNIKKSRNATDQSLSQLGLYKHKNDNFFNSEKSNSSKKNIIQAKDIINNTAYYIGEKTNNQKNGFGIKLMADEAKYIGFFKNNKSEGYGKFITDTDSYYGEFFNDQANGFGIYNHKNETIFIGYWKNDLRDKYGIESWKDSTSYIGEFNSGEKNGLGQYIFSNGSRYEGEWKNNKIEGYGIYFFLDKRIYIGEWKNNMKEGFGEFIWNDKIYIGFYSNDKKNGFGIYYWKKMNKAFMGFWKNGKQYGFGKLINKDKIIYGTWVDDKLEESYNNEIEAFNELEKKKLKGYKQIFLFSLQDINNYCTGDGMWEELLEYSNQFGI